VRYRPTGRTEDPVAITLEDVCYRLLPRVEAGRALAHGEWLTLVAAAECFLEDAPVDVDAESVADNVERFLCRASGRRAWRIRLLCQLVEWLPFALTGRRFSQLSVDERRALARDRMMQGGRLWSLCGKIRFLTYVGAYGDERAANRETGYVPIPLRSRLKRESQVRGPTLARLEDPHAAHPAPAASELPLAS
jgi:hypothetical protein